jgi:hypothetical protein
LVVVVTVSKVPLAEVVRGLPVKVRLKLDPETLAQYLIIVAALARFMSTVPDTVFAETIKVVPE